MTATVYFAVYPAAAAEPTWVRATGWSGTPVAEGSEAARQTDGVQNWATLAEGLDHSTDYKIAFVFDNGVETTAVVYSDLWTTLARVGKLERIEFDPVFELNVLEHPVFELNVLEHPSSNLKINH